MSTHWKIEIDFNACQDREVDVDYPCDEILKEDLHEFALQGHDYQPDKLEPKKAKPHSTADYVLEVVSSQTDEDRQKALEKVPGSLRANVEKWLGMMRPKRCTHPDFFRERGHWKRELKKANKNSLRNINVPKN